MDGTVRPAASAMSVNVGTEAPRSACIDAPASVRTPAADAIQSEKGRSMTSGSTGLLRVGELRGDGELLARLLGVTELLQRLREQVVRRLVVRVVLDGPPQEAFGRARI